KAFDMVLYYYNPNIDTREEHDLRARELLRLAEQSGLPGQAVAVPYDPAAWLEAVRGLEREREGGRRCEKCFALRLRQSARYAAAQGFDYFTTTLSISPLKSAALLNRLGVRIGQEEGVAFLQADFKKRGGFLRSTQLSKQYGIYRQDYCGCAFSKRERDARRGQDQ
ncbi:MAG: epoxyqueuosine reductase QueH, partial [Clostridiales bacterium]|nr:epoxyqueuosine reductase QueH [Clostridiales bacterium]